MAHGCAGSPADGAPPAKPSGIDVARAVREELLTPEFFAKHWERAPLHWSARERGRGANRLPEAISVDDIVALIRRSGPNLKMFRQGDPYDSDSFPEAYLDGASMIVNQADRFNTTLYEMSRSLAESHFMHVFSVVYLTPPGSQAVRLHNDDQDVFLLQVLGKKRWTVREAPKMLPYTEEMLGKDAPVPEELIGPAIMAFTMEAGDILYIPRGCLHEAATGEAEPSLHVTVTVPTSDYCWGVHLVRQLARQLGGGEPGAGRGGGPGPRGGAAWGRLDDATLDAHVQGAVKGWLSNVGVDCVLDEFDERIGRTNEGQARQRGAAAELRLRPWVTEASRVRLMPGTTCRVGSNDSSAIFARVEGEEDQRLEVPIPRSAAALVRSLSGSLRWVSELPCQDPIQRIFVLQMLQQQGVLQLFLRGPEERAFSLGES
ncbi:unnamed protein product [Prorocentrum cordatum]|uniref:Bifunctional lysine-specific demethylase and histidyl-hydroxylase n=1 Tax=Prorocentrum cordatum TaxID=2364126 RepID=A0ABN9TK37_9DINO|nr:unnamed protein product [Polarella glacialis]